jgi:hypothetical protein
MVDALKKIGEQLNLAIDLGKPAPGITITIRFVSTHAPWSGEWEAITANSEDSSCRPRAFI